MRLDPMISVWRPLPLRFFGFDALAREHARFLREDRADRLMVITMPLSAWVRLGWRERWPWAAALVVAIIYGFAGHLDMRAAEVDAEIQRELAALPMPIEESAMLSPICPDQWVQGRNAGQPWEPRRCVVFSSVGSRVAP